MAHRSTRVAESLVIAGACLVAGTIAIARPSAQTPPAQPPPAAQQPQQPTFRTRVDSVSVDVAVTDKQGKPVTDLTAADFEIRESSKPQVIDTFKFIKVDDAASVAPETVREIHSVEDQEREAARDDMRLLVIFLDDYHVRRGNGLRARDQLANFVSALGPRDLVAIMYPTTSINNLEFTHDHATTAQAILHFEGRKYDYTPKTGYEQRLDFQPPEISEMLRNQITITALRGLCAYLGSLRDGRKSVLFFSEGLASTLPAGVNSKGSIVPQLGTSREQSFANAMELQDDLKQVYAAAARGNASIYTLDPRGLSSSEFQIDDTVNSDADKNALREATDSLHTIADQTGGRAIINRNDPSSELRQMLRDTSAYYLLSYTSSLAPRDGKFHEIQVRVNRKDVDVRARKGYWAYSADDVAKMTSASAPKAGPPADVAEALDAIAETTHAHAVSTWLGAERSADGKGSVTLVWEANAKPDAGPLEVADHISVVVNSVHGDLLFRGLVARDPQAARASGRTTFEAPPGAVHAQIAVENSKGQRIDRDDKEVEVPDFTATGPVLTTPAVFRGRTARDVQQIRSAASPMPAVAREFSRTERLLLRFQAYGPAGSAPTIAMRLLNQLGQSMAALPAPVRTADGGYEAEIGLGGLPPGQYLIEITAEAAGGTAKQLVAMRVTG